MIRPDSEGRESRKHRLIAAIPRESAVEELPYEF